jgi:hypothetical protein
MHGVKILVTTGLSSEPIIKSRGHHITLTLIELRNCIKSSRCEGTASKMSWDWLYVTLDERPTKSKAWHPSAWEQNVIVALATVVYVKFVIFVCDALVKHRLIGPDLSRKVIHVAAGTWLVWWPLFDTSHPTWRLNVLVPAVFSAILLAKGLQLIPVAADDPDVRSMSRTGRPAELLEGPLHFTLVMVTVGLFGFNKGWAVEVMAALGLGDGLAPVVGRRYGRVRLLGAKTLEGSLTFFAATLLGQRLLSEWLGFPAFTIGRALLVAVVGTVAELFAPARHDNLFVPLAVVATSREVQNILGSFAITEL